MIEHVRTSKQRVNSRLLMTGVAFSFVIGAAATAQAQAIYNSIPNPLPPNVISAGPEAYGYREIGDGLVFAAGGRTLTTVKVVMSSFACQSGHWSSPIGSGDACVTTPGATFNQPITLNIYATVGNTAQLGSLLATKTMTFQIPYRPSSDAPHCGISGSPGGDGAEWYNAGDNTCNHGLAVPITFDFTSQHLALPNQVVVGITFDTTHFGYHPIGTQAACYQNNNDTCPYDSLNVSTENVGSDLPFVGANIDQNGIYVNWTDPAFSCSGQASNTFQLDTPCWGQLHPEIEVDAVGTAPPPTTDSVTPNSGSGLTQTFTFKYSSVNGYNFLNTVFALFNSSLNTANGCAVYYVVATNSIFLINDAGNGSVGSLTPGFPGTISNSQCTISGPGSSVSGAGNTLTLNLAITFSSSFKGLQSIFGLAIDNANQTSGWKTLGTWTPSTVVNTPPTADSVTPSSGSGLNQTFTFKYSSVNGYKFLNTVYALINGSLSAAGGCIPYYVQGSNSLYLINDSGTGSTGPIIPGSAGSLSNSQCLINGPSSTVSGAGNTLTLMLSITFNPSFKGLKTIFGLAIDNANLNSGWQTLGTWTPSSVVNTPPTTDTVTPSSGSGANQTFLFKYSSANGYQYLNVVYALINSSLSAAGGCIPYYVQSANAIYLLDDSGNSVTGPLTPGSGGSLSNSQCTINGASSSVSGSGNTLSLSLAITFKPAFTGTKTIFGLAIDNANNYSGWKTLGTWTLP